MLIEFNKDYRHKGNGEIYRVHEKVLMKMPDGSWVKASAYQRKDAELNGQTYIRTDKNFVDRFVPIAIVKDDQHD